MARGARRPNERELLMAALAEARRRVTEARARGAGPAELRLLAERVERLRERLDACHRAA